jgi:hypothetical protein
MQRRRWFVLFAVTGALLATSHLVMADAEGVEHTDPQPKTVSGLSNNLNQAVNGSVNLVACIGRRRTDDQGMQITGYNFLDHLNSECDMQVAGSHEASIRIRCTAGPDPVTGKTIPVYYDTRIFKGSTFQESQAGRQVTEDAAFDYAFAQVNAAIETEWDPDPVDFNVPLGSDTVLYKAGVWQGFMEDWTSVASVGL